MQCAKPHEVALQVACWGQWEFERHLISRIHHPRCWPEERGSGAKRKPSPSRGRARQDVVEELQVV